LDAYLVKIFPANHPDYQEFLNRIAYWDKLFANKQGLEQKGYLKLKIGRNVE